MDKTEVNAVGTKKSVVKETVKNEFIIPLKEPILFEERQYDKIDLTGLKDIRAKDMIDIHRLMTKAGNVNTVQELTLEYAMYMANIVTGLPVEFFDQIPPYAALAIKRCVVDFIYGQE